MNHYPHHLGDYAKDTMALTQGEHGAYRLILDAYYAAEQAPAAEDVYAIAKASTPAERKAVEKVLRKFELRDGRYYHKRVEAEIAAYQERKRTGQKNVAKRYQTPSKNIPAGANDSVLLASSHKPVASNQEPAKRSVVDPPPPPESAPVAALAAACVAGRVNTAGMKPLLHLRQWAAEGVTDKQLTDAIAIARDRKPEPELLHVAYLAPIIADLRAGRVVASCSTPDAIAQAMANIAAKEAHGSH